MTTTATEPTTGRLARCRACRQAIADTPDGWTADTGRSCPVLTGGHLPHVDRATMADVAVGDVLWESGLRCVVTEVYGSSLWNGPEVIVAKTRILNLHYLQSDAGRYLFGGIIARDGSEGWTFQGIPSRTVAREVRA
jgi:hypothetical protein